MCLIESYFCKFIAVINLFFHILFIFLFACPTGDIPGYSVSHVTLPEHVYDPVDFA